MLITLLWNEVEAEMRSRLTRGNVVCVLNVSVTSGAGPRAVGTERGQWS